jgi:S-disulfanyl-L-cysteine oxidoreductase SoxD
MPDFLRQPNRGRMPSLLAASGAAALLAVTLAAAQGPVADKSSPYKIWQGVYTMAQAERGKHVFHSRCAHCHLEDLTGGDGPALVGGNFGRNWGSRHLDRLYTKIREKMPPGEEFLVTDAEKIDIVAFMLNMNGFPAGDKELTRDAAALASIQIVGQKGPEPAPTGAMVEAVGCLVPDGPNWKLTNSTDPSISTMDDVRADAKAAVGKPAGTSTIQLLDVFPKPDAHKGHKMMAKGLLIRNPTDMNVNVLAMEMVSPTCP